MAGTSIKKESDDPNLPMTAVMMGQVPTAATTSLHAIYAEDALGYGEWRGKPRDFFPWAPLKKSLPTQNSSPPNMLGVKLYDAFFHFLKIP